MHIIETGQANEMFSYTATANGAIALTALLLRSCLLLATSRSFSFNLWREGVFYMSISLQGTPPSSCSRANHGVVEVVLGSLRLARPPGT